MFEIYWVIAMTTAGYVLGSHHEAGNDNFGFLFWSVIAGIFWPVWLDMAAYYGIREGK